MVGGAIGWRRLPPLVAVALVVVVMAPGVSRAEQERSGDLVMSLRGEFSPLRLPRHRAAPASVTLASHLKTVDGAPVAPVRRIEVSFARAASLSPADFPACPRARLRNATAAQARRRCPGAVVGRGRLALELRFAGELPLRREAHALVLNGRRRGGRAALWMHVFVAQPPVSFVLPFAVRRTSGGFPTVLAAPLPRAIAKSMRVRGFAVTLGRRYRRQGRLRSYVEASCPVPRPFTAGFLPVARVTFGFPGARSLSDTIVRSCRARG